jgi:hypothetical protein
MQNLCSHQNALFRGTKLVKRPFCSIGTKMMFGSVTEHFANLWHVKRWKTCVRPWTHYSGTKGTKHPLYSIGTKMMFGSVSEHFTNLRHVKICKTCFFGLNALFRGTKVVKHPFYSIRTKMMFGSASEHFANLRHVKRRKTCVRTRMHYLRVSMLWSIHFCLLDPTWCLGVFQSILLTFDTLKDEKLVFCAWMHYLGYQTCVGTILLHWNQNDVWECFRAFR